VDDAHMAGLNTALMLDSPTVRYKGKVTELPVAKPTVSQH